MKYAIYGLMSVIISLNVGNWAIADNVEDAASNYQQQTTVTDSLIAG